MFPVILLNPSLCVKARIYFKRIQKFKEEDDDDDELEEIEEEEEEEEDEAEEDEGEEGEEMEAGGKGNVGKARGLNKSGEKERKQTSENVVKAEPREVCDVELRDDKEQVRHFLDELLDDYSRVSFQNKYLEN